MSETNALVEFEPHTKSVFEFPRIVRIISPNLVERLPILIGDHIGYKEQRTKIAQWIMQLYPTVDNVGIWQ